MLNKTVIKLCHGSSCFARGNKSLVRAVQLFIQAHQLEDKVSFSGDHCFDNCSDGPNMRVNGKLVQNISPDNIKEILEKELSDIL